MEREKFSYGQEMFKRRGTYRGQVPVDLAVLASQESLGPASEGDRRSGDGLDGLGRSRDGKSGGRDGERDDGRLHG